METFLTHRLAWNAAAAAVLVLGIASAARADERLIASVPFDFFAGDVRMPAGDYVISQPEDISGVLAVSSKDGRTFAYVSTISAPPADASQSMPELLFKRFEGQYFLSDVFPSPGRGREIPLSSARMSHDITLVAAHY